MGAWAAGPFSNDDALDFLALLYSGEEDALALLSEVFDGIADVGDEYLEAPQGCEAIAAAEVVARLSGRGPATTDPDDTAVDAWVAQQQVAVPAALVEKARKAVDRVASEPSELLELWSEGGVGGEWRAIITSLQERLSSP